jgi:hypothetical protein
MKPVTVSTQSIPYQEEFKASIPKVLITGSMLSFEGMSIDLGKQALMIKLFKAFIDNGDSRVSRLDLIRKIYGHTDFEGSSRQLLCDFHNIVKLISRARKICETSLYDGINRHWMWFDYDPFTSEWVLVKPRYVRMTEAG